jgi:hypothetical protein
MQSDCSRIHSRDRFVPGLVGLVHQRRTLNAANMTHEQMSKDSFTSVPRYATAIYRLALIYRRKRVGGKRGVARRRKLGLEHSGRIDCEPRRRLFFLVRASTRRTRLFPVSEMNKSPFERIAKPDSPLSIALEAGSPSPPAADPTLHSGCRTALRSVYLPLKAFQRIARISANMLIPSRRGRK